MKFLSVVLVFLALLTAHAKVPNKSVPSTATQYIFETLVKSTGDLTLQKAPKTIEAKNIECTSGSGAPHQLKCSATFNIENIEVKKDISGDNNKFFQYLTASYIQYLGGMLRACD